MKEDYQNIDNLFARELKDYTPKPPDYMWERIEQRIPQEQNKKTPFLFYKIAASIALLLFAGSLGLYLLTHSPEQENLKTSEVIIEKNTKINPPLKQNTLSDAAQVLSEQKDLTEQLISNKSRTKDILPVNYSQEEEEEEEEANKPLVVSSESEQNYHEAENQIASMEPKIENQSEKEDLLIYIPEEPVYSEAYKTFLSEFESPDEEKSVHSKWAVGGQAGPQYSYRKVYSDNVSQEFLDKYNAEETGLIAYAGGINIAFKPARRLTIQSGVYYSKMGQTAPAQVIQNFDNLEGASIMGNPQFEGSIDNTTVSPSLRVSTSMGSIEQPAVSNTENAVIKETAPVNSYDNVSQVNQYLEFLEIPLMARYAIIDRKINFHFLGGLSTNFLIASPVYLDNGDYYTEADNLNVVNYSSTLGLGLGYNFSSNLMFSIEPQFKYYLNKVNSNSQTEVHPYSFGVFTGVTYLF